MTTRLRKRLPLLTFSGPLECMKWARIFISAMGGSIAVLFSASCGEFSDTLLRARFSRSTALHRLALISLSALMLGACATAQTVPSIDDPQTHAGQPPPPPPDPTLKDPELRNLPRLRVDTNLVLVPVTVTDGLNRLVTGLQKDNFYLFENNVQQTIRTFSTEDAPVSIGIVLDLSGSMTNKVKRSRDAIIEFLNTSNPQDEYFVIAFNDRPELIQDFTSSTSEVESRMVALQPGHRTALLDAMYFGIRKMRTAKYERRALVIVSDGGDNRSRYTEHEVRSLLRESDLQIYAIGIFDQYAATPEEQTGPILLNDFCDASGGRMFQVSDLNDIGDIATKISSSIRSQYVLGYSPIDKQHDGKWRKLKVRLAPPPGLPVLAVHARTGYYAPAK